MSEHEPTPAPEAREARHHEYLDFRRLDVAQKRFGRLISNGIDEAMTVHTEIDHETARCIAHVLGRAYGRESALATFGRTGKGQYLLLRDEYLAIYTDERASDTTKQHIDWLGTYLVQHEGYGTGRRFMNEQLAPRLDQLLVRTALTVRGDQFILNIPASWDSGDTDGLIETLTDLQLTEDVALQAFLSLPDVSAGTDNIMESFHEAFAGTFETEEDALRALSPLEDWENSLADWCIDQGIDFDALQWNCAPLMDRLRGVYDVVELNGVLHAFVK